MYGKNLLLIVAITVLRPHANAQFLKKIKDKVNKTINSGGGNDSAAEKKEAPAVEKEDERKSVRWCDTVDLKTAAAGKDGITHTLAYSGAGSVDILYDESFIGLSNDAKGYRIILSEKVNGKLQFLVIENGKVIHTDDKIDPKYISRLSAANHVSDGGAGRNEAMQRYIVGDTLKQNIPKRNASSTTIEKVDEDQFEATLAIARQMDDYKNMTDAEKKEFDAAAKTGLANNNAMAGKTISAPAQQAGTVAVVTGYYVVVKGKKYGKFQIPPVIDVSLNETNVFAVGLDEKALPAMIVNGKKTLLDKNKYSAVGGYILRSPDLKKFVYVEPKKLTDQENMELSTSMSSGNFSIPFNVLKSDGSHLQVSDYNGAGKFKLTNTGQLVSINEKTGQIFADNKAIGKFPLSNGDRLESEALLIGNSISQLALYNGNNGSITYLDGTEKKLNITFPNVVFENGQSYLSWFRKCRNDVYIAKVAY